MRGSIQIKLPASIAAAATRLDQAGAPRRAAVPAREPKLVARPHVARRTAPRRVAY
ncbi:hypothetical protein [Nonomuraea gerenzanensis]|uniref:hypothetical protein n=1 Tax=Nonomuraea gerenzanensis TaxID=93944 RepID=UPI001CDA342E|nr:hypothetical protein [Nonomuraea gerenzanensis]UBU13724.1 hypothetical protein LCN96_01405 [Nonomuraea gerenzanensis]